MPEVLALILNWNGAAEAIDCVSSLRASSYQDFSYAVLDNGSTDDSLSQLRRTLDAEHVKSVGCNKGYAGGMNEAIELWLRTDARFGLLMTQDARLEPKALGILVGALNSDSTLGIVGPMLFDRRDGSIFGAGGYVQHRGRHIPRRPLSSTDGADQEAEASPLAVDRVQWLDGCCLLLRREAIESVGRFDERFFLYVEDVDLCHRARLAGWEVGAARAARASQIPGATTSKRMREYYILRNKILFCRKHFGPQAAIMACLSFLYYTVLCGRRARWVTASTPTMELTALMHGLFGRGGQMPKWIT